MSKHISFQFQGTFYEVDVERNDQTITLTRDNTHYTVELIEKDIPVVASPAAAAPSAGGGAAGDEKAPITGTIREVKIQVGDTVKPGQLIFVLEAMKMDIEVFASTEGSVKAVLVNPGDNVMESQALATIG